MLSSTDPRRSRRTPTERRREIISHAARIGLDEGLERITVRAAAESVGVRPGLISHYFPVAHDLVVAAFEEAAGAERDDLFPDGESAIARIAGLVRFIGSPRSVPLSRLWLNARHLARFSPDLAACVHTQERIDHARLTEIIEAGITHREFAIDDAAGASTRILMAVDGYATYVNEDTAPASAAADFVGDCAEWALGLEKGTFQRR